VHDVSDVPLVGGHPALDLVNSVERGVPRRDRDNQDFLVDPLACVVWATRVGLLRDPREVEAVGEAWRADPRRARQSLDRVIAIRESAHTALRATLTSSDWVSDEMRQALEDVHSEWQAAVTRSTVSVAVGAPIAVRVDLGADPVELIPDRAAQQALDLLTGDELPRLRECPIEAGGCGWLFLDHSRNGSRRWCRMADCGNKVKAKGLTARRRAARVDSAQGGVR
jgi:predicted RNA-binding Zn ribbon-like protein